MTDIIRVLRVYEFVGPRELVERQVANSIHGERVIDQYFARIGNIEGPIQGKITIKAATIGAYPEILGQAPAPQESSHD